MSKLKLQMIMAIAAMTLSLLCGCTGAGPGRPLAVGVHPMLAEHNKLFGKGVVEVTDKIHVAIGFGISNSIMIEGQDGLIIVDTMTTREEAAEVLAEFRKISRKPIKAIIYTHYHPDHTLGSEVFAAGGKPAVYSHKTTPYYVENLLTQMRPCIGTRSMRMYGNFLSREEVMNVGIGPFMGLGPESTVGFVQPTRTFSDVLEDKVAGVRFKLCFAPGETDDQIFVWLPDKKVLIPGDNFYWSFPNLYTIRGTPFRSLKRWYQSIDRMRDLNPEYLIPCHTRPIVGVDRIQKVLTDYRDAIQFVHDQSVRAMNMGMTPDEMAEWIVLPPHLKDMPCLQPFYGKVSWSVRSMFAGNLGWFDGDSASLQPLTLRQQAEMMVTLAGGEAALLKHAREYLEKGDFQTALQLTGHLVRLNEGNQDAKDLRVKALVALGEKEQNPNARHYYLTEALEIRDGFVARETATPSRALLHGFPLENYFDSMAVNLNPEACADLNQCVGMVFPDVEKAFSIHVRYGVAEIRPRSTGELDQMALDIKVVADSKAWKEMLGKIRNPVLTLAGFQYEKGNMVSFARFLAMFEPAEQKLPYEPLPK
ncbi:MAG: MBL fold metallo-hydrolase [Proteobacteria bacterium]|nr:MBL fold metallo-hydrolase [Pseudomonadota bacterium]